MPGRRRIGLRPGEVLGDAKAASTPGRLRDEFATETGTGGIGVSSLDGVAETPDYGWRVRVDGSTPRRRRASRSGSATSSSSSSARRSPTPARRRRLTCRRVKATKRRSGRGPRVAIHGKAGWSEGDVAIGCAARAATATAAAAALLTAQFRKHRGGGLIAGGSTAIEVGSGCQGQARGARRRGAPRAAGRSRPREAAPHRRDPRRRRRGPAHPREAVPSPGEKRLLAIATTVALAAVVAAAAPGRGATVTSGSTARAPRRRSSTAPSPRCPTASTAATAAAPTPARARRGAALGDRHRRARRRDARRRHPLARKLGPELPRLLHRPHRPLRFRGPRPLLVADGQRPLLQRRLPRPVAAGDVVRFFYGPALRRSPAAGSPGAPGGGRRPAGRKPTPYGRNRPIGQEAAADGGPGGALPAAQSRRGRGGTGGAWPWPCERGAVRAQAAASTDPRQARTAARRLHRTKTSTRPRPRCWRWSERRPSAAARAASWLGSVQDAERRLRLPARRPTRRRHHRPRHLGARGRGPTRAGAPRRRLRPLRPGRRRRLPVPPRRRLQRPEHRPRARRPAGHRPRPARSAHPPAGPLSTTSPRPSPAATARSPTARTASSTPVWTTAQALLGLTSRARLIGTGYAPLTDFRPANGRENQRSGRQDGGTT